MRHFGKKKGKGNKTMSKNHRQRLVRLEQQTGKRRLVVMYQDEADAELFRDMAGNEYQRGGTRPRDVDLLLITYNRV